MKRVAIIPARMGSQRLPKKNLVNFLGMPLVEFAIKRCQQANCFDQIVVNSEDIALKDISARNGVEFYHRQPELANNESTSEDFIADYFAKTGTELLFQVHSITPLLKPETIRDFVEYCLTSDFDTVLSNVEDNIEVSYKNQPVNFTYAAKTNSQDLKPIQRVTWSITYWKRDTFLERHHNEKCGTYSGKIGYFTVPLYSGLAIKTRNDLEVAQLLREKEIA